MTLRLISFLRRHGYFGRAKIAESHLHHAAKILSSGNNEETEEAIASLNSALQMYPDWEKPLELKAKALLRLKRYKEVVELLHSFLPSLNSSISISSNNNNNSIRTTCNTDENEPMECFGEAAAIEAEAKAASPSCGKCFCIRSNLFFSLKRKPSSTGSVKATNTDENDPMEAFGEAAAIEAEAKASSSTSCANRFCVRSIVFSFKWKPSSSGGVKAEGGEMPAANSYGGLEWRYLVLGQACYHLGMMEDAMALLCKGKRAASEASRRRCNAIGEDDFCCHRSTSIAIISAMDSASLRKQRRGHEAAMRDHHGIRRRKDQESRGSEADCDGIRRRKDQESRESEANRSDGNRRRKNQEHHGIEAYRDGIRGGEYSPSHHDPPCRHHRRGKKIRQRSESSDPCYTADLKLIDSMISNIKLLVRRRSAASIALEAGLYSESARHLTKLIEGRRAAHHHHAPASFITDCYLHRAIAHQAMGKVVDAIADCNHTLALNPKCTKALSIRASLHELVRSFTECLLDLQQLKMVFEANLRSLSTRASAEAPSSSSSQQQQQQQQWKLETQINGSDLDMISGLEYINSKIIAIRRRLSPGLCMLDARAVLDMPQHCSMEDVEKAYLLISLKHSPEKAFFSAADAGLQDGHSSKDVEMAREEARASAVRLSKLIHKAYTKLLSSIAEEEKEKEKEKKRSRCWHKHCDDAGSSKAATEIDGGSGDGEDRVSSACIETEEEDAVVRIPCTENAGKEVEAVVSNAQRKGDDDIDLSFVLQAFKGLQLFGNLPEDQDQDQCLLTWSLPHLQPQPLSVP